MLKIFFLNYNPITVIYTCILVYDQSWTTKKSLCFTTERYYLLSNQDKKISWMYYSGLFDFWRWAINNLFLVRMARDQLSLCDHMASVIIHYLTFYWPKQLHISIKWDFIWTVVLFYSCFTYLACFPERGSVLSSIQIRHISMLTNNHWKIFSEITEASYTKFDLDRLLYSWNLYHRTLPNNINGCCFYI